MDGLELRQTLMQTLANGLKKSADDRAEATSGTRYAELTGRIEVMRTLLEFLVNADVSPCPESDAKEGQELKDPGPPVEGGSEEETNEEEGETQ